jgi:hypothetical protein
MRQTLATHHQPLAFLMGLPRISRWKGIAEPHPRLGKNTLHLIGLDDQGAIVVREKVARGRITARLSSRTQARTVTSG